MSMSKDCVGCNFCDRLPNVHTPICRRGMCEASENDAGRNVSPFTLPFSEKNRKAFTETMEYSLIYIHLALRKPQAFLLLSYFSMLSLCWNSKTFTYVVEELRAPGHRPALTEPQARRALIYLEKMGYISIEKIPHRKPIIEVTLLRGEFPYV